MISTVPYEIVFNWHILTIEKTVVFVVRTRMKLNVVLIR